MSEERFTLAEAEILLNRRACLREGHVIEWVGGNGWCAGAEGHYRCSRCDVEIAGVTLTYPPLDTRRAPYGATALADPNVEPDFGNVAFERGSNVMHFVRRASPNLYSHPWQWVREEGIWLSWAVVVQRAEGAQIYAWNDGEFVKGKADEE